MPTPGEPWGKAHMEVYLKSGGGAQRLPRNGGREEGKGKEKYFLLLGM